MTQGYFFSCLLGKEVVVVDLENDARISRFAGPAVSTNVVKIGDYFLEIFFTAVRSPKYVSSMESDQSYIFHLIHERNFLYSDLPIRIVANQMSVVDENRGRSDVEIEFEKNDYAFINKVKLFVEQCPFMYDKYEEKKSGNSVVWSFKEYKGPKVMLNDSLKDKQKLDILKSLLTVLLESQRNCLYLVKKIPPANMLLDTENNLKVHWICFSSKKSDQIGFALASLESMRMMGDDIDRRIDAVKNFIEQHGFTADIFDQDFLSETYPMNLNGWKMLTVMSGSSVYFYDKTGPSVYRLKEDNLTNFEICFIDDLKIFNDDNFPFC
ncbi:hypothetical protein MHBO_001523 [Bonamia ostreae]|uniref:Uncharacterized protein n=1 Tax=Bonamia ostreae TaxID=126728 RepID=A0ABV2AK54_9EUKA